MNTMRINFRKVQAKELAMMYHRPDWMKKYHRVYGKDGMPL